MSKPAAGAPRPTNWLIIVLWSVGLFLLMNTFFNKKAPQGPQPTKAQLYSQLIDANKTQREADAAQIYGDYSKLVDADESNIDDQVKAGKLSKDQADLQKQNDVADLLKGAVIVSDAQLRGGEKTGNYNKYFLAYQTLTKDEVKYRDDPIWTNTQITLVDSHGLSRTLTPATQYAKVLDELSVKNRETPVWGFMPGYQLISAMVHATGAIPWFSYWFAPLLLAIFVRGITWPLTRKQLKSSRRMQQLLPQLNEIKKTYPGDMHMQQQKQSELYKEYGINPFAGCAPLLIQLPFFWMIYECMLRYRFEFQKGTFAWINPASSHATHGFFAPNLGQQDQLLIIIYGVSMLISQWLMPVSDPTQLKQQRIMGVIVSLFIPVTMLLGVYPLPSAFVLYWTFTNIIATSQMLHAYREPVEPLVKVSTVTGGAIAQPGKKGFWDRIQTSMQEKLEEAQKKAEEVKTPAVKPAIEPPKNGVKPQSAPRPSGGSKSKPKKRS